MEFPTTKLVIEAKVATREEMKELVLVLLVRIALLVKKLVVVALLPLKLVVKKLVEVPLVIREEEAKIFWTKRLRNLLRGVPRE